jgi:hypothetical protein
MPKAINVANEYDQRLCAIQTHMAAYREAYDLFAKEVRAYDSKALMVAVEAAPRNTFDDVLAFWNARPERPDVDVLGLHPYGGFNTPPGSSTSLAGVEYAATWARAHGLITWATEYGCKDPSPGACWSGALTRMEKAGIRLVNIYELYGKAEDWRWDTGLLGSDGTPRPGWTAVVNWARANSS